MYKDALITLDGANMASKTPQEKQAIVFMRGAMYEHQKDYDEAEKAFRTVLKSDPDNAGALNYLGYMLADRDVRLDEAQQLISKAVDLDPDNGAYLDSLGWCTTAQNRLDQAADELRRLWTASRRIRPSTTIWRKSTSSKASSRKPRKSGTVGLGNGDCITFRYGCGRIEAHLAASGRSEGKGRHGRQSKISRRRNLQHVRETLLHVPEEQSAEHKRDYREPRSRCHIMQ